MPTIMSTYRVKETAVILLGLCVLGVLPAWSGITSNAVTSATIRDIVGSGMAKAQLIEKRVNEHCTDFELILTDAEGNSIGGYAPPYLADASMVPTLWRDFVSMQLAISADDEQITVREDRKTDNQSYAVAFVLDHSPSMTMPRAIRMQRAVMAAMRHFNDNDYVSVIKFTARVSVEVSPTNDKNEYLSQFKVNGLNLKSDGTAIFDGAMKALKEMRDLPTAAKRVLIVFTDGEDNASTTAMETVLAEAKKQNAQVFAVTYGVANDNPLVILASETNGRIHRLQDVYDFDKVFLGIYRGLRHSYVVSVDTRRPAREDEHHGAITTTATSHNSGVCTHDVLALVPKFGVKIIDTTLNAATLVLDVDLTFLGTGDVHPADVPTVDSLAALLIQRNDLTLEIVGQSPVQFGVSMLANEFSRQVDAIRELLIRCGVNPDRVIGSSNCDANRFGKNTMKNDRSTTFVLSKL